MSDELCSKQREALRFAQAELDGALDAYQEIGNDEYTEALEALDEACPHGPIAVTVDIDLNDPDNAEAVECMKAWVIFEIFMEDLEQRLGEARELYLEALDRFEDRRFAYLICLTHEILKMSFTTF